MKWYASKKIVSLVVMLFLGAVFSGYFLIKSVFVDKPVTSTYVAKDGTVYKRTNVLLLGIDARAGEEKSRTDTIILASVDPESNRVALLSIPRDTLVNIPGHGKQKINSANFFGGPELTKKVVEELTGVPINYHVMTNFDGFKGIIDTLGGVNLDVEKDMVYRKEGILLKKGPQKLDGDKALQYVRFRSDALGDISRTQRQQKFLKAIASEALQIKTVVKLPKLVPQISEMVVTNMSVAEMAHFANMAKKIEIGKLVTQTLPGNFYNYLGISYWKVDEANIKAFVQALLTDGETADFIDSSVVNKPSGQAPKKQVDNSVVKPKEEAPASEKDETEKDDKSGGATGTDSTGSGDKDSGNAGNETGTGNEGTGGTDGGSGTGNTGTSNSGTGNSGSGDTGSGNSGSGSTGTSGTGTGNSGSGSTGTGNTGSGSTGISGTGTTKGTLNIKNELERLNLNLK